MSVGLTSSRRRRPGRGGLSLTVSALGLALAVVGGVVAARSGPPPETAVAEPGSQQVPPFVAAPRVRLEPISGKRARPHPGRPEADRARGVPLRLALPRLGVDVPVVETTAPAGILVPPPDPQVLGWWADGAVPGARRGSALVTGHTVSTGGGALDDLELMRVGDRVRVRTAAGVIGYRVTGVRTYRKASLAQDAHELFSQTVPGRLVLVTCEDWDGSVWRSNVVVMARPVG